MRNTRQERLSDNVAVRTTAQQRAWLEQLSHERRLSMGESIRLLIDQAMARAEAL